VLHELADPPGVLDVGLGTGNVAQVVRIHKPALEALLERLEHRLPVHARGLHPDQRHPELSQPRTELGKPTERRLESPGLLLEATTTDARHAGGRHDLVAVHIHTGAPVYHHIHRSAPFGRRVYSSPGAGLPHMSLTFALAAAINGPTGPRATLSHGL